MNVRLATTEKVDSRSSISIAQAEKQQEYAFQGGVYYEICLIDSDRCYLQRCDRFTAANQIGERTGRMP